MIAVTNPRLFRFQAPEFAWIVPHMHIAVGATARYFFLDIETVWSKYMTGICWLWAIGSEFGHLTLPNKFLTHNDAAFLQSNISSTCAGVCEKPFVLTHLFSISGGKEHRYCPSPMEKTSCKRSQAPTTLMTLTKEKIMKYWKRPWPNISSSLSL